MTTPLLIGFGAAGVILGARAIQLAYLRNKANPAKGLAYAKRFYEGGFESPMSKREASLILGIRQTADAQKITERYRLLMKLNHPDLGGSPFIAQKVNEAKELLLKSKKTN